MSLTAANAGQLLSLMECGDASAVDVTQACLDRIAAHDDQIGAFIHVDATHALAQAERVDARRTAGPSNAAVPSLTTSTPRRVRGWLGHGVICKLCTGPPWR